MTEENAILLALLAEFTELVRTFIHEYDQGTDIKTHKGTSGAMDFVRTLSESSRLVERLKQAGHKRVCCRENAFVSM